jgi:hypothetical protein
MQRDGLSFNGRRPRWLLGAADKVKVNSAPASARAPKGCPAIKATAPDDENGAAHTFRNGAHGIDNYHLAIASSAD